MKSGTIWISQIVGKLCPNGHRSCLSAKCWLKEVSTVGQKPGPKGKGSRPAPKPSKPATGGKGGGKGGAQGGKK